MSNYVVAPQRWDERGRQVKTDKRDARELVDRLDRYVRGNTKAFAVVRVPTPQQEQKRGLVRQRGAVLKEMHSQRIGAADFLCARERDFGLEAV